MLGHHASKAARDKALLLSFHSGLPIHNVDVRKRKPSGGSQAQGRHKEEKRALKTETLISGFVTDVRNISEHCQLEQKLSLVRSNPNPVCNVLPSSVERQTGLSSVIHYPLTSVPVTGLR